MLRKSIVIAVLCLVPAVARAQAAKGPFEFELGGSGANGTNFNGFTAAGDGSVGYFFTDVLEGTVRQSIAYSDTGGVGWDASTRVGIDLNFPLGDQGQIVPFIGGNLGYDYGHPFHDTWEAAPEGGLKLFVNGTTFLYATIEYQFHFDQHTAAGEAFSNGQFNYGFGLGFRF